MEYLKTFKNFNEQIELLEQRGIKFNIITKEKAEKLLSNINYYKLSGYIKNFEIGLDKYDIEFSEIIKLYKFDRKLSIIIFGMIEEIEIAFKTKLIYSILERTKNLGTFGYLETLEWKDYSIYDSKIKAYRIKKSNDILKDKLEFKKRILEFTIRESKPYIENYFNKYKNEHFLPLWILSEIIDFGMATKMYEDSIKNIQDKVAKNLGNFKNKDFIFYLKSIKLIRNTVAHNGILWNFRLITRLNKPLITKYQIIDDKSIMAVIIIIAEILKNIDVDYDFKELKSLIKEFFKDNQEFIKKFGILNGNVDEIDTILI